MTSVLPFFALIEFMAFTEYLIGMSQQTRPAFRSPVMYQYLVQYETIGTAARLICIERIKHRMYNMVSRRRLKRGNYGASHQMGGRTCC